jgi:hypothetical protein
MQALSQLSYSPIEGPAVPVPGNRRALCPASGGLLLLLFADGKPKIEGQCDFIFSSGRPPGRRIVSRPERLLSVF